MIPMGYTNVVQIYQADMSFILQDEIPHYSYLFIDNLSINSVTTQHENPDGSYETIPDNLGICHFIWEHLQVIHWILQCLKNIGAMVSAKKFPHCTRSNYCWAQMYLQRTYSSWYQGLDNLWLAWVSEL